jgi:hypothetical protein
MAINGRERGLYQERGIGWFFQQKQHKRLAFSLETRNYVEAIVKAGEIEDDSDLNTGMSRPQLREETRCCWSTMSSYSNLHV